MPLKVKKPVFQKPRSTTSPLPNEGRIPKITENKYINNIPITKVGSETPNSDNISMILLKKLSLLIPVQTPRATPEKIAIIAEIKTNSNVAGNLSAIKSETGLLNWYESPNSPLTALPINLMNCVWTGSFNRYFSRISSLFSEEASWPTILCTGSPTKLNKEKETNATTIITSIDCISLIKK